MPNLSQEANFKVKEDVLSMDGLLESLSPSQMEDDRSTVSSDSLQDVGNLVWELGICGQRGSWPFGEIDQRTMVIPLLHILKRGDERRKPTLQPTLEPLALLRVIVASPSNPSLGPSVNVNRSTKNR